jgi:SAM-dependent methyltransferase
VSSCCGAFSTLADRQFTPEIAQRDLQDYRAHGPEPTAVLLRDSLAAAGLIRGSLLDVGSGIGALTFELLAAGATSAIAADASSAYIEAAREEAERRHVAHAVQFIHGDFLDVGPTLPAADIVTLDRVVCCYPAFEPLLREALRHTREWFAFSYPRGRLYVRAALGMENLLRRVRRNPFRTFVHPPSAMIRMVEGAGLRLASRRTTLVWSADVWVRSSASQR